MKKKTTKSNNLLTKYGQLTVLGEHTKEGRRYAKVRCVCGTEKDVLAQALTSGKTRSCGARGCKYNYDVSGGEPLRIRGSQVIPDDVTRKVWKAITRKKDPLTVTAAGELYGVERMPALYAVIRNVQRAGGLAPYFELVKQY